MSLFKRFLYTLFFGAFFGLVIYFIPPPKSWGQASYFQMLIFFIPFLLFITSFLNIFLNYLPRSFALGLGLLMVAALKALDKFNILTLSLVALATALLVWFIPKSRLTKIPKIPKLSRFQRRGR